MANRRDELDPIVERSLETLRQLPEVNSEAVSRIVGEAARTRAQDLAPNDDDLLPLTRGSSGRWRLAAAAALLAGLGGAAVVASTSRSRPRLPIVASSVPSAAIHPAVNASHDALADAPIPTQFVFEGPARHVSLVGDFNNWDEKATPLERELGSSLWSVTVPIQRGRHIYAFLVDSKWTVDKRAPVASDPDFGVTGSVILVGRP